MTPRPQRLLGFLLFLASAAHTTPSYAFAQSPGLQLTEVDPDAPLTQPAYVPMHLSQFDPTLSARRRQLLQDLFVYNQQANSFNTQCGNIDTRNLALVQSCTTQYRLLRTRHDDILRQLSAFNQDVAQANARFDAHPTYIPTHNALIGGTGWIVGYNIPEPNSAMIATAHQMIARQEQLAGHTYSDAINFQKYNFVLGIAAETSFFLDLVTRVISGDELTNGQYSIDTQPGYAAMAGRSYDQLSCHSNGAMLCLAALRNHDITATHVTLYGPQITPSALREWDQIVRSGQVKSVTVVINESDPVPPYSLAFGDEIESRQERRPPAYGDTKLLDAHVLASSIEQSAPRLLIHTYPCSGGGDRMHCHSMSTYKQENAH